MEEARVVHYTEPQAFFDALKPYDDGFMNFALGSFLDSLDPNYPQMGEVVDRTLLAVYKGENLLMTLARITNDFAWMCSTPSRNDEEASPGDIDNAIRALVALLPSVIDPTQVDSVIGPRHVVARFIEVWVTQMQERGMKLRALDPYFESHLSYATLVTLPPPSPHSEKYRITQVQTEEDVEAVAPLAVDFSTHGPKKPTLDQARQRMRAAVAKKELWICRMNGEVAGYTLMGRTTPRTIAIRNVYVPPTHRRKGIAEAMVRALTRFYLGAEPLGFEGAPSAKPEIGTRDVVCLNVVEEAVVRLYKRCGFLLGDGDRDPITGRDGSIETAWLGVEQLTVE